MKRARTFWRRITDGVVLGELWKQFQADARTSYRLYSKEIETARPPGRGRIKHFIWMAKQFLWAIFDKLTPARRVLLLAALIFLIPDVDDLWNNGARALGVSGPFWGVILLLVLLLLEISDRVVMKRDLQIAKEIQAWLLPPAPPAVPGLEIAFTTRPANTVAGDYYDVFPRHTAQSSGSDYLIAIADVAGKSVPAAMLMATFQASLKTLSATESPLTELVSRMNNYACSNSQNGRRFTTAFIAEYEPASRTLSYVNAGHNAPILRRRAGAIDRLQEGGIPLGIQQDAAYQSGVVTLEAGDWLVIFTDGVTEAENTRAEEYGEPRLLAVLNANLAAAPQTLLSSTMIDLDRFVGDAAQHDDITLLLLKAV